MAPSSYWVLGQHVTIIPGTNDYTLCDISMPAGVGGPPPHIHHDCSEHFYVVEGSMDLSLDGKWHRIDRAADFCVPRGAVHTFRNASHHGLRFLVVVSPAGFDRFFREMGVPADLPDAFVKSMDSALVERVLAEADRYQMEFRL